VGDSQPSADGLKFDNLDVALDHSISVGAVHGDSVLVPVGRWILDESELISEMTGWRQAAKDNFFAKFPASTASFTNYLVSHSLAKPDTVLFMIYSGEAGFKGHIGLTQITARTAEIDAVMLSASAQGQGLAEASLAALISWGKLSWGIDTLTLEVLSSNAAAISLYLKLGFEIETTTRLKKVADGTLTLLVDCEPGDYATGLNRVLMLRKAEKF